MRSKKPESVHPALGAPVLGHRAVEELLGDDNTDDDLLYLLATTSALATSDSCRLAQHPRASTRTLRAHMLSEVRPKGPSVASAVLQNPNLDTETIEMLVRAERFTGKPMWPFFRGGEGGATLRHDLAKHPSAPPWLLGRLVNHYVVDTPDLPMTNAGISVLLAVMRNVSTPVEDVRRAWTCISDVASSRASHVASTGRVYVTPDWLVEADRAMLCAQTGVDPRNRLAIEMLLAHEWRNLTPESPEVLVAKTVHADP